MHEKIDVDWNSFSVSIFKDMYRQFINQSLAFWVSELYIFFQCFSFDNNVQHI